MLNRTVFALALLFCANSEASDAVVSIGNAKGVIISPSGLVVTAEHVTNARQIEITLHDGTKRQAILKRLPQKNYIDEAQVYHILGGGEFPYVLVSNRAPAVGDVVSTAEASGEIVDADSSFHAGAGFQTGLRKGLVTNWPSRENESGSPLLDSEGKLIGVLSMSGEWPLTYWVGLSEIHTAVKACQPYQGQRRLVMFSTPGNKDCDLYCKEIVATGSPVTVISTEDPSYLKWKTSYEHYTKQKLDKFPTFWVEATNKTRSDSYRPGILGSIFGWFKSIIDAFLSVLFGAPSAPAVDLPPTPEGLDPSKLTIIALAKKQDVGLAKGKAIELGLDKIAGPLQRRINEEMEGKARVVVVPERTRPEMFKAITEAAKLTADPGVILVLVRSQSLGLKSLIAKKVERSIEGKVPDGVPVEIIFERIHSDSFHAIEAASLMPEPYRKSTSVPAADVKAAIKDKAQEAILKKMSESENKLIRMIGKSAAPKKKGEEGPFSNGLIAGLVSILMAGYTGREGYKSYKSRIIKRAAGVAHDFVKGDSQ
jgi:hypothetical protein